MGLPIILIGDGEWDNITLEFLQEETKKLMSTFKGFRFFDDTDHWHRNFFDGVDVPIENFNDLKIKPVSDIIIMSLTFGGRIKEKINSTFGNQINVLTLNELIIRACNHEK
jgi:hypothetical protein